MCFQWCRDSGRRSGARGHAALPNRHTAQRPEQTRTTTPGLGAGTDCGIAQGEQEGSSPAGQGGETDCSVADQALRQGVDADKHPEIAPHEACATATPSTPGSASGSALDIPDVHRADKRTEAIWVTIVTLDASQVEVTVLRSVTLTTLRGVVEIATGVPAREQVLVCGGRRLSDPAVQPFGELEAGSTTLTLIRTRPLQQVSLTFGYHAWAWETIMRETGPCALTIQAGCRASTNARYWPQAFAVLEKHGDVVQALRVRHIQGEGKLALDVLRSLAGTFHRMGLRSLDLSWVLPGSAGLSIIAETLPSSLEQLELVDCADNGGSFPRLLSAAVERLPLLTSVTASGQWDPLSSTEVAAMLAKRVPPGCEVSVF